MDNGAGSYRRFLAGDESAFDDIIKDYRIPLTSFIFRYVRNAEAAEDIAIDVFTYLIIHPHRYNFKTGLKTYLFMLGRSRALDYLKHARKMEFTDISEHTELMSADPGPEEQLISGEKIRTVREAVDALPEKMRTAVFLVYFENMSYADAARIMKKSRKQIDNLLYRAKSELRSVLGEDGEFFN